MEKNKQNYTNKPFFQIMGGIGDGVVLSVLWLVCSLPVVTIGASATAAFSVAGKMVRGEDYFVGKDFFTAFRRDFSIATRAWLPMLLMAVLIAADYQIGVHQADQIGGFLIVAAAVTGIVWLCAFAGCFALLGRFSYAKASQALKDALILCLANLKASLIWLVTVLLMPALYLFVPPLFYFLRPLWIFLGGGISIIAFSFSIRPAFIRLEKK